VSYQVLSAQAWAEQEFGAVDLKDRRLTRRVVRIAAGMAADPQASIPKQNQAPHQSKAAYRLFNHERAIMESLCDAHWQQTRLSCSQCPVVLLIQDTTWLDYSAHPQTQGLGWVGHSKRKDTTTGSGLFLHSVLAVEPQGQGLARVIGLAWATLYARTSEPLRGNQPKRSQRRKSPDRESQRWIEVVQQVGKSPPLSHFIHVGDRESDIYELYEQAQTHNSGFVIRLNQDRNASVGHDTPDTCGSEDRKGSSIKQICCRMPVIGSRQLWISPRAGRAGRWATLSISAAAVTLWSPQLNRTGRALRC
jgi:Transposase DNA-binding